MTGQQLKNSILQMAVQGKLVPQDPNDEPASVLLERIRAEKEQLIKEGKIKKEKNPSIIFRGADNLPYEKVGKNEPICIADEVPFDIPESWEWVRLGTISTYAETKKKINAQDADPNLWGLDLEDIEKGGQLISQKTVGERKAVGDKTIFKCGDILYSKLRPYLLKILVAPNNGICTPEIVPFNLYGKINAYYIVEFLKSPYVDQVINSVTYGVKMPRVGTETMTSLLVPLPPISEQARIVARLKCVLSAVQSYNTAYDKGEKLTTEFPIQLKKSILQYAVQGKLVPQDPADEPASVLLERIRTEKEQLVKEGKIKRDKHESVIFRRDNSYYEISGKNEVCIDDQIPFDVPESWEWTRTGSLFQVNPRNRLPDDLDAGFMPMPLLSDGFGNHHDFQIRKWKEIKTGFTHFADGDIVIAKITPCFQNRKSAVISGLPNGFGAGTTELHVLRDHTKKLFMPYCLLIYKTHAFIEKGIKNFSGTAGQQRIGKELISDYLIPIPPLEEQKRIVSAVESIFKKLGDLLD
jgi:type I restriction enzyme S subunit